MNPIKSLMGRRQFLIAAGVGSTTALAYKKLAGVVEPVLETSDAFAAEKQETADKRGANNRYSHLLSPVQIRNVIVKNRIMSRVGSPPHYLQGPEDFHTDILRTFYSNMAKAAAIISARLEGSSQGTDRSKMKGDSAHMARFDASNPAFQNYVDQIIEGIHSMGSLVSGGGMGGGGGGGSSDRKKAVENAVTRAKQIEEQGYDVISGGTSNLQDKDAVSLAIDQMKAIRSATNLIITISVMVQDPTLPLDMDYGGAKRLVPLDQAIAMAKTFDGAADIMLVHVGGSNNSHVTNWNMKKGRPLSLRICELIKESGSRILLAPNGGFHDPDLNEEFIASGKCDMVLQARSFNAEPDYGKKIYEGRGEDVVPCLLCNKCHGLSMNGPWYSVCSVNPKLGLDSTVKVIDPPTMSKKVAVIGGGPAGMKAAITAAERGHKVTIYEKNDYLGGLLRHADYSPYKWTLKDYKDYLIRQVKKAGIEVRLSTTATPEMIKSKEYDVVLAAVGAEPFSPRIPGSDGRNVWKGVDVYGREKELGKNVVFIGGGEFGVETAMYLANAGHNIMILTSEKELLRNERVHGEEQMMVIYDEMKNFDYTTEAIVKSISEGKVTYTDANGNEKSIPADSVVIWGGLKARTAEAMKFSGSAGKAFFAIGDCTSKGGNVQRCNHSAFYVASQI
jgi:thioredoxin reductase